MNKSCDQVPDDKQLIRARDISQAQINKIEELWKSEPDARFADLDRPEVADETELAPTLLHYEDGYHYQNIVAPLVKMEADYDKQMKESLTEEGSPSGGTSPSRERMWRPSLFKGDRPLNRPELWWEMSCG